jgi:GT2 family glycosyltransferase
MSEIAVETASAAVTRGAEGIRVSVCMPTYQGRQKLEQSVPPILEGLGRDDELIVCVDGSRDGSQEYLRRLAAHDLRLRVLENAENVGRTRALNVACTAAKGRIVIRLDDDISVPKGFFDAHVRAHEAQGAPVGVTQRIVDVAAARRHMWRTFVERNASMDLERHMGEEASAPACTWGGACSVKRDVGVQLGWYDERFSAYGWEDVEFGYRLVESGVRIVMLPDIEVEHLAAAVTFEHKLRRGFDAGARMMVFAQLHGPQAVLRALGHNPHERELPAGTLGRMTCDQGGWSRRMLTSAAVSGEAILSLLRWRRPYDGWVARWLTWSYARGWYDEASKMGLPLVKVPTEWGPRMTAAARERWYSIAQAVVWLGSPVGAVGIMRSAMLRRLETARAPRHAAWRQTLGALYRLWSASLSGKGRGAFEESARRPLVYFEDVTPSATRGLMRAVEALEAQGTEVRLLAAAPFVREGVRERYGRECVVVDDAAPRLEAGLRGLLRAWRGASALVRELCGVSDFSALTRPARIQLTAEASLADVLLRRLTASHLLADAQFVLAASEYYPSSIALREAAREAGVRWSTLQHGAVNFMYAPFSADEYLAWSAEAGNALVRLQPQSAGVRVVGSPLQSAQRPSASEVGTTRGACGLADWDGPVVCVFSQTHGPEFSAVTHFAFAAQLRLLLDAVPTVRILLKRHPSESRSEYETLGAASERVSVVPDGVTAAGAASVSDVAVALGSTALIDAMLVGCVTVEVLCDETLMEQAVSDTRVGIAGVADALRLLVTDPREHARVGGLQWEGRERFLGPEDFDARLTGSLGPQGSARESA